MARETKVGLLAGLAFIVCFAVILANRGRQVPLPEQPQATRFQFTQGRQPTPQMQAPAMRQPAAQPSQRNQWSATNNRSNTSQSHQPPLRRPALGDDDPVDTRYDQRMADAQSAAAQQAADARIRELEQRLDELSQEMAVAKRDDIPLTAPARADVPGSVDPAQSETQAQARQADPAMETTASGPAARPPARISEPPSRPLQVLTRYKVVKGDTLSKIASMHYNAKSKRLIDALMDANRGVLTDPNLLKVGMELMIPVVEGVQHVSPAPARHSDEMRDGRREQPSRERRENRAPFRWYQIQKNDRYVGIARRELGDEGRWREIFEMNKETFPDPSRIRPGVRIKLPALAVADTREGRRP